jgi:subtilisin family serine protease
MLKKKYETFSQKVDPKLRMYQNCEQKINEKRSFLNGNLQMTTAPTMKNTFELQNSEKLQYRLNKEVKKTHLRNPSTKITSHVFVELTELPKRKMSGEIIRMGNLVSARIPLTQINQLAAKNTVVGVEVPRLLRLSDPVVKNRYASRTENHKELADLRKEYPGRNKVLIGIIDVGGFDFAHPDFLDERGKTRFLRIWDQGSTARKAPQKYKYGAEFLKEHLDKAIAGAAKAGVPATALERQSSMSVGSHGTHVASIAAGNSGIFPGAAIVGVTISIKPENIDGRKSFYDSASLVHAVDYLLAVADEMKLPISINVSLGTNGHAHDGSDAASRWINSALSLPGRCVSVAAGNAGQEKPLSDNDLGYTMGRIHTSGKIEATGLSKDITWTVAGNTISDISENELEIWYAPQDRMSVKLKPPGQDWIGPVGPNEFIENQQLKSGSFISIYNDLFHFSNGLNYIGIYLAPNYKDPNAFPIPAGNWLVRLTGVDIRNGEFDGWIERDDPRPLGNQGSKRSWNFPSYFGEKSNVDSSSISSLACANYVIAVGNCDHINQQVHISSSQGPTRDKRNKPEIIAPGTDIVAAKGFSGPGDEWISMTGTSMASPYVCGIAAWMLSLDKNLSASQIQGIMIRTSRPLPGCDYKWKDDCGFGLIDPRACLQEAKDIRTKKDLTK